MFSANGVDNFSLSTEAVKLFPALAEWDEECERKSLCWKWISAVGLFSCLRTYSLIV